MSKLEFFLRNIPKAELHVHFAGTLHLSTLKRLINKYGSSEQFNPEVLYNRGEEFNNVLPALKVVCKLMREPEDFHLVAYETQREAAENGVRYREMFWNPSDHTDLAGVPYRIAQDSILEGFRDAEQDFGIIGRLIPSIDRESSPARAVEMVEEVIAHPREETLGIGIDYRESKETAPENFIKAYQLTENSNLFCTAHAGENDSPSQNIEICLDLLKCDRIDHGYTVLDDDDLTLRCLNEGISFTTVPTNSYYSKTLLGQDWAKVHPIKHMVEKGLNITINSDDPHLHHTDPGWSYVIMVQEMDVTIDDVRGFIINSIDSSWAPDSSKKEWRREWLKEFDSMRLELEKTDL